MKNKILTFFLLIINQLIGIECQLNLEIFPAREFRVLALIDGKATEQKFVATCDDPNAKYTWMAPQSHSTIIPVMGISFYKEEDGYRLECTAESESGDKTETINITINADYGVYRDETDNTNGIKSSLADLSSFEELDTDQDGNYLYYSSSIWFREGLIRVS